MRGVDSPDTLAPMLRSAATRAARHAGGALALIFMRPSNGETGSQLRSAAGFTSPADARAAGA
ncbi:MAG: hypothetical protein JSU66_03530, partial [Deltaproteobacteria bacterium]